VFNILLQILDDGRLTDAKGKTVDFKNTVVIMTSNLGASEYGRKLLGFGDTDDVSKYEDMKNSIMSELKKSFRPEFINRIDEIIVFRQLTKDDIRKIVELMLLSVTRRLTEMDIKVKITDAAKDYLSKEGFDNQYGARPLKRAIQRLVEDRMSEELLLGNIKYGDTCLIDIKDNELTFEKVS